MNGSQGFHIERPGAASGGAPSTADYLVGTADAGLSAEIVVGTTPGGELGGTWAAPTVDAVHSGSAHHAQAHNNDHATGGADAFAVTDLLDGIARVTIRKNTGVDVGSRRRVNLIEGTNITLTVADDAAGEEVDVTIDAAGGSGAPADADYLVGTAHAGLSAEIVVGTSPGGELGGTWASPTVDATHSGSAHHAELHTVTDTADHTFPGGTTTFLRADGTFAAPTAAAADPSYSPGSFTVVTETARVQPTHLKFTTTQRATIEGTGRLVMPT